MDVSLFIEIDAETVKNLCLLAIAIYRYKTAKIEHKKEK